MPGPEILTAVNAIADHNAAVDATATPYLWSHLNDPDFAKAGGQLVAEAVTDSYDTRKDLSLIDAGGGDGLYSGAVMEALIESGFTLTGMTVLDINADAQARIPKDSGIKAVHGDITKTQHYKAARTPKSQLAVVDRHVDHYLPTAVQTEYHTATLQALRPGELHIAQISTGIDPETGAAFGKVLAELGGKKEGFPTVAEYLGRIAAIEIDGYRYQATILGSADSGPRTAERLAPRYIGAYAERHPNPEFDKEIAAILQERDTLAQQVIAGETSRDEALDKLHEIIAPTKVFEAFQEAFVVASGGKRELIMDSRVIALKKVPSNA